MRFPVFARRSNPRIDSPILRKSKSYVTDQVNHGLADWVDLRDFSKGIVAREMLYFGERPQKVETADLSKCLPPVELPGVRFILPIEQARREAAKLDWQQTEGEEREIFWQKSGEAAAVNQ